MADEHPGHSLQATALVNEAYLRLVDVKDVAWQDRAHFLAVAARAVRRILVDHARARHAQKRGGEAADVTFDEALQTLATFDERKSRVIEMRFFGGLTEEETAGALNVSRETVKRDWKMAKLWLLRELRGIDRNDV